MSPFSPRLPRVRARASYPAAPGGQGDPGEVLVLHLGENPTTDYYLRPRLEASGVSWRTADLRDDPQACALLSAEAQGPLSVIVCRYAGARWLDALERARPRLSRAALMIDDDLAGMLVDPTLPLSYRAHVARWHGRWTGRLSRLVGEVWASTPVLARRYGADAVLPPIPEADPPAPDPFAPPLVVYPGQALHRQERAFVLEVARLTAGRRPDARFEVVGADGDLPANVQATPERPWPLYQQAQAGRFAAISLAPLFPSTVNTARAPVKAFDAARVGAVGLYAEAEPFMRFVRDGVDGMMLPMRPDVWAHAIVSLLERPAWRLALAEAARQRLVALRRDPCPLPERP